MGIKISILIPAYKPHYLAECISSCLAQSYNNFEIIIVDDASPFDLFSIVRRFSDYRIKYYRNEHNCGAENVVDNWNICLSYATGDYIICMGDDDMLKSNCLNEYVQLIKKHPNLGVYHAQTEIIDEFSHFKDMTIARTEFESVYSLMWHRWHGRKQYIGDFLFDTKILKSNSGFYKLPLAWGSDDITAYIAASVGGIANIQKTCFCYRKSSSTISSYSESALKMEAIKKEADWCRSFLQNEPLDEQDKLYRQCLLKEFDKHFEKKKGQAILSDIKNKSFLRIFYWMFHKKKYDLTKRCLIYAIIQLYK